MKTALLLMAHGSRQEEANADLFHVVAQLRSRGSLSIVEGSFLELAAPTIEEAAERCLAQGAEQVIMVPYFLSAGLHFRRDLTNLKNRLAGRFPHVQFYLAEPLGRHPLLLEIVMERANQVNNHLSEGPQP
jgi:sirohydrochlorin ferrochelatase